MSPEVLFWYELALKMAMTAASAVGTVAANAAVAMFALVYTLGGPAAGAVFSHAQPPLVGLGLGFLAVHYLAEEIGVWWA
jgi:hypothetical protein